MVLLTQKIDNSFLEITFLPRSLHYYVYKKLDNEMNQAYMTTIKKILYHTSVQHETSKNVKIKNKHIENKQNMEHKQ